MDQLAEDHPPAAPQPAPCTTRWISCPNGHHLGYRYKKCHHYRFVVFDRARADDCVIGVPIRSVVRGYAEERCTICGEWIIWSGNSAGNVYLKERTA